MEKREIIPRPWDYWEATRRRYKGKRGPGQWLLSPPCPTPFREISTFLPSCRSAMPVCLSKACPWRNTWALLGQSSHVLVTFNCTLSQLRLHPHTDTHVYFIDFKGSLACWKYVWEQRNGVEIGQALSAWLHGTYARILEMCTWCLRACICLYWV